MSPIFADQPDARLQRRPEAIRRQTLVTLRWIAVVGQAATLLAALAVGVRFAWLPAALVIALGASLNLWLSLSRSRVTQRAATAQLLFDLIQISLLIGLTGGLSNPFALLVIAPVTIAATALEGRWTILVGAMTIMLISVAGIFAVPLSHEVYQLTMPPLLQLAHWVAIVIAVVFFAGYAQRVSTELAATSEALFATQLALSREQRLQALGGVVAAAAHEMGTPLGTIKLVAAELRGEIIAAVPDRSDMIEDAEVIASSADRCRDILRAMGKAGKADLLVQSVALSELIEEAAAPHTERGTRIQIALRESPIVHRDAGVLHGLRNIIQNAVDFARHSVTITSEIAEERLCLTVQDDGPGFPPAMLERLAEPFPISRHRQRRGGDEGMGLGLFIARTLLESSGARVQLSNENGGASVRVCWPLAKILGDDRKQLGTNPLNV